MFFDRQSLRRIGRCVHLNERQPPSAIEANRWNAAKQWFWVRIIGAGSNGTYRFRRIKWTGIGVYVDIDAADRDWLCSAVALSAGDTMVAEFVGEHFPTTGYRQPMYRVRRRATGISANTSHGQLVFSAASVSTWTCPSGVAAVQAECWGGGGSGGNGNDPTGFGPYHSGGGGGGGEYSIALAVPVTAGTVYTVTHGAARGPFSVGNGNDSWFSTSGTVLAKGGTKGGNASAVAHGTGGAGGTGGIGDTQYAGGSGAAGVSSGLPGGGGSSAGTAANGNNATGGTGGTAPSGGGRGWDGDWTFGGIAGSSPGGGGAGSLGSTANPSVSGAGQVTLTW